MLALRVTYRHVSVEVAFGGDVEGSSGGSCGFLGPASCGVGVDDDRLAGVVAAVAAGVERGVGGGAGACADVGAVGDVAAAVAGGSACGASGDAVGFVDIGGRKTHLHVGTVEAQSLAGRAAWKFGTGGCACGEDAGGKVEGAAASVAGGRGVCGEVGPAGGNAAGAAAPSVSGGAGAGVVVGDEDGGRRVCVGGTATRGPNWARNREWKQRKREVKQRRMCRESVPEWRRGASAVSVPSLSGSVRTVDTRTAEEIEAQRTFAARKVVENKIAIAKGEHVLTSLADKEKTAALQRLAVARMEERINTARARSQASYKKCGSEIESAGSAASAGEFALKQELRQKDAWKKRHDYLARQMDEAMKYLSPAGKQAVADLPEPYIPTDAEIAAQDEDVSPFKSFEEMQEDMRRYFAGEIL